MNAFNLFPLKAFNKKSQSILINTHKANTQKSRKSELPSLLFLGLKERFGNPFYICTPLLHPSSFFPLPRQLKYPTRSAFKSQSKILPTKPPIRNSILAQSRWSVKLHALLAPSLLRLPISTLNLSREGSLRRMGGKALAIAEQICLGQ